MVYRGLRVIAIAPCWNEGAKIGTVLERVPRAVVDEMLVVDDGSTDDTARVATAAGATVIGMGRVAGVGAALRMGYRYALDHGYHVAVVMAGNNKDSPEEIPRLLEPLAAGDADVVQGSRYLGNGARFGHMPLYRRIATRLHPILFSLVAGRRVSESTNGFRAVHRRVLEDERLDLEQDWLDGYELEPYLYVKAIRLGFRTVEVPVTKIYPPRHLGQTKMRPFYDWWSMLRPLVLLALRVKR
jgi:dolichol-phosphate mannosyltransferase